MPIRRHLLFSRLYSAQRHVRARNLASGEDNEGHSSESLTQALQKIYARDIVVTQSMLEQSISNIGDTSNLRRAFRKLVTGQPIKVVALGGSVTFGHGPRSGKNAFVSQLFQWIQQTFPHPSHQLLNHGLPAVTSAYICPCVLDLVTPDVDLVLLEFTLNDSERGARKLENPITRSMERMLRKLMRLQTQPGIVYIHYWAGKLLQHKFADTAEDTYNELLKFYGLMGISMRDAFHQLHWRDEEAIAEMFKPEWDPDPVHPSCVGSRYIADLLIGQFQDLAASELLSHHLSPSSQVQVGAPEGDGDLSLGPPLQADNWGVGFENCLLDPQAVQQLVRPIQGFEWIDEGRRSPKWGFVGRTPGDALEIDVPVKGLSRQLTIGVGFLLSYDHMGQAGIDCVSGCTCRRREYSFLHPYHVSMSGWRVTEVENEPEASSCTLRVSILNRTNSDPPEHKVKVTSVMITEESGFTMPWLFCDACAS